MRRRPIPRSARIALAGTLAAIALAIAALPLTRAFLRHQESNPVLRGRLLAEQLGCHGCHLPPGNREIPNPGSRWGSVPRFGAGNAMMYVADRDEIAQFIRFGAPAAWRDDPAITDRLAGQHLRMPAFGERLAGDELSDLVAYVCAVEGFDLAGEEAVAAGRQIAREQGCVACHGIEGAGGLANPGSLGGFVPGFAGGNFPDLVSGREEFGEWVREGTSSRLAGNPLVRYFWGRQALAMPAYGDVLTDEEIDLLWEWVGAVRAIQ